VTVNYGTADGTALAGNDYAAASGIVSFLPGQTSRTVSVSVNGDTTVEGNETFLVNLSSPTSATIGDSQGVGTIRNNDGIATIGDANFSSTTGLALVGTAKPVSGRLQLTPAKVNKAGAGWYTTPQAVQDGFNTTFQFQSSAGDGGVAFVIQNSPDGTGAIGWAQSYLGYKPIANTFAVAFNYYTDQIQLSTGQSTAAPVLNDGQPHAVNIDYLANAGGTGGALRVFLDGGLTPVVTASVDLDQVVSLAAGGKAWIGFTASSNGYGLTPYPQNEIVNWSFAPISSTPPNDANKFLVVDDGSADSTYRYAALGNAHSPSTLASGNTAPRGVAANAAGTTYWVADANKTIYVYNAVGGLLGSWTAGGLPANAQVEGIAVVPNGTDVWLVDNSQDKVFKYTGAAGRLSGSQSAANSFNLNTGNSNGKGIVTDGTSLWVVNDSTTDKVFKYTLSGSSLGNWSIDAGNSSPTGLTINSSNVSDIWIVDSGTDKVYQYTAAASRTSGSQIAAMAFSLAADNSNPQDIADPPGPGMPTQMVAVANFSFDSVATENLVVRSVPTRTLSPETIAWLARNAPVAFSHTTISGEQVRGDRADDVLTLVDGNVWFLFNWDGVGGFKKKTTNMTAFESNNLDDIDWLTSRL
jgi:Calx-beta domain